MAKQTDLEVLSEHRSYEYAAAKHDFGLFTQAAWDVLEPETELKWNWHHDLIAEHLQAAAMGQIRRLIINVCPRSTKSILATICFPDWLWISDPSTRFLFGSYSDSLAKNHSVLRRNLLDSEWYRRGYGHRFSMSPDVNTKNEFANNKTGVMRASGIGGAVIGFGADYVIADDPHDPKGAESERERETTLMNFDLAWTTRLNNKKTGRIIVIMQRLHENDLTGHLLERNHDYVHLKIPTIAEERERIVFPVTGRVVNREAGDLMHPDRDGPAEIAQARQAMGPYGFSGQHQQTPTPKHGSLFEAKMFHDVDLPDNFDYKFCTMDTAYDEKKENDFTVITAFGVIKDQIYILDVYRKQIKASEVEGPTRAFINRFSTYGFRGAWIEPKGHGIYLNGALTKKGPKGEPSVIIPNEEKRKKFFLDRKYDKVARANNAVPHLANRRIFMNKLMANKEELVAECLVFPKGRHDDFVDTLVDGIKFVYSRQMSLLDAL